MAAVLSPGVIEARLFEEEHRRVRRGLAALQETVASSHWLGRVEAIERLTRVLVWLRRDLLPHAAWEEAWLYPRLDRLAGSPWMTRALRLEHQQIRELAVLLDRQFDELHGHWSQRVVIDFVAALARLEALISSHLSQEDRFVVPLLDEPTQPITDTGGTSS